MVNMIYRRHKGLVLVLPAVVLLMAYTSMYSAYQEEKRLSSICNKSLKSSLERNNIQQEKSIPRQNNKTKTDENLEMKIEKLMHAVNVIKESRSDNNMDQFQTRYAKKLSDVTHQCNEIQVWGGTTERDGYQPGTKRICFDEPFKPPSKNCLVYSFGINEEWTFDLKAQAHGCEVYAFDPSMKRKTSDFTKHIHFYKMGITDTKKTIEVNGIQWSMLGYQDVVKMLGHQNRIIDILKVDIEKSEWDLLPQMLMDGSFDNVKQLLIELHNGVNPYTQYLTMEAMEAYGLKMFHYREVRCTTKIHIPCAEVAYVNAKFSTT